MFALHFLKKQKFDSYADYLENAIPVVPEHFNFAYDVIDALATESPDDTAVLWLNDVGEKKILTFRDLSLMSNSVANFLHTRGINRGDTVLLFMRRRWVLLPGSVPPAAVLPVPGLLPFFRTFCAGLPDG